MKWFKHISDSLDDPFIENLLYKFGAKGYLGFFGTIEIVARECRELDEFVTLSWRFCVRKMKLSRRVYEEILNFCVENGRFELKKDNDIFLIRIPKLKELADEYSLKKIGRVSGVCRKNIRVDIDKEAEVDKEYTPLPPTPVQYLLNQWRSKNRLEARNLKLSNMAEAEISAALNRGIKATEIEKIIWDTAGKGIKPWELFQRPSNKIQDPSVEAINKGLEIARKYAGGTPPSSEHEKRNSGQICGLIDDSGNELEGIL